MSLFKKYFGEKITAIDIEGIKDPFTQLSALLGVGWISQTSHSLDTRRTLSSDVLYQWLNSAQVVFASAPNVPVPLSSFKHPYFPFVLANQAVTPHSQEEMINTIISILDEHDSIVTYGNDWDYLLKHFTGTPEQLQKIQALLQQKTLINPLNILIALDYADDRLSSRFPTLKLAKVFRALFPKEKTTSAIKEHEPASDAVMALAVLAACVSQSTNNENHEARQGVVDRLLPILATSITERKKILEQHKEPLLTPILELLILNSTPLIWAILRLIEVPHTDLWLIYFHPPDSDKAGERTVQLVKSLGPDPLQPTHWLVHDGQHVSSVPLTAMPLLLTDREHTEIFQGTYNSKYRQPHVQPGTRLGIEPEEKKRLAGAYWKETLWDKQKLLRNAAAVTGAVMAVSAGLEKECIALECHDVRVTTKGAKSLLTLLLQTPLTVTKEVLRIGRFFMEGKIPLTAIVDTEAKGFANLPKKQQSILTVLFNQDDPFPIVSLLNQHMTNAVACAGIGPLSALVAKNSELKEVWVKPWLEILKKSVQENLDEVQKAQSVSAQQNGTIQLPKTIDELYELLYAEEKKTLPRPHNKNTITATKRIVFDNASPEERSCSPLNFKTIVGKHLGEDTQASSARWLEFLEDIVGALSLKDKEQNPLYIAWREQARELWREEYYKAWGHFLEDPAENTLNIPRAPSCLNNNLPPVVQTALFGISNEARMAQAIQATKACWRS